MKPPPPMPHEYGSPTPSTLEAAIAASTALPPRRRTSIAAWVPCESTVAAPPPTPTAVGCLVGAGVWWAAAGAATRAAATTERSRRRMAVPYPWPGASYPSALAMDSATVVMKFGGTSVADAERLKRAAQRIVAKREAGHRVVAVLSARGKETDRLIADAHEVSPTPDPREMDMLLSTGERVSCALCAMAINDLGHRAISLTGSQAGIVTDTSHTKARILDVRADRIFRALEEDSIVLVAGFQGVSTARDVTTLGRGGSDTTAVAVAAALAADVCEIYTDVAGVYSADPRIVPGARLLPVVSFEEMLEMAASGARVLQLRSVEYARNHGVRIHCRSSFEDGPGTFVLTEEETMERPLITAVTHSSDEARITLLGVPDTPGVAGRIFTALADANVNVDMIIQNEPATEGAEADMSFTVPRTDLRVAREVLDAVVAEVGISAVAEDAAM